MTTLFFPDDYEYTGVAEKVLEEHGFKCTGSHSYSINKKISPEEKLKIMDEIKEKMIALFSFDDEEED